MLEVGKRFPDFALPNQDGKTVRLSDFARNWLVVYFYPKDDTPDCTMQAEAFTASSADFEAAGIRVVGVSQDDADSHKKFCGKYAFTVDLLADTNADLIRACGIGQSKWLGFKYWDRTSFVIDPDGVIRKVYQQVQPKGHEQILLEDIKELQGAQGTDTVAATS